MQHLEPGQRLDPTMTMEEKIGFYPDLSPEQRREVEDYVDQHPHLREALEQVQRLDRALREGRALREEPPGDEALAWAAVAGSMDTERLPSTLQEVLRGLEQRIESDPELRGRFRALQSRKADLEAASDVENQIRHLVKSRTVVGDERSAAEESRLQTISKGGAEANLHPPAPGSAEVHSLPEDGELRRRDGPRRLRRFVTAVLTVAAVYLLLFAVGRTIRPPVEKMARFEASELVLEGYDGVRGAAEERDVTDAARLYLEALGELRAAETSFLGLFPRYDSDRLATAADRLGQVIRLEPAESFLAGEAAYLLGKTELARGNLEAGREALHLAAASRGAHADEAEQLLHRLVE